VPVHPVVKADAYGHGAIPVARALEAAGVDGLCVATLDEALALRGAALAGPILVLYPIPAQLAELARSGGISVTAGDPTLLAGLLGALGTGGASSDRRFLDIHLEVETGLGRGGSSGEALLRAARTIQGEGAEAEGAGPATARRSSAGVPTGPPAARLAGLWTHLQAPEDAARTRAQVEAFERAWRELEANGIALGRRHLGATGSLVLGDVAALDGVRPGLAIYGLVPDEVLGPGSPGTAPAAGGLRPVLSLHARPVRVADLPAGHGISYGPTYTTRRPSRIATLPLGYGDGWPRSLSNRAEALVRGVRAPLVGNVAMDAVMADVTDVPGAPVSVGDEFVLIGEQGHERITVADLAAERGTNSWEVVTSLAARLPRVYHAASAPQEMRTLVPGEVGGRRST
jgi:alanine racemase